MARIPPDQTQDEQEEDIVPWTAEQVRQWRESQPLLSMRRVIGVQVLVGGLLAMVIGAIWGLSSAGSALYGVATVVLPAGLFAVVLNRQMQGVPILSAVFGFFVGELIKIGLTVLGLVMASRWLDEVHWPALLAGLVVTMKVYWVALGMGRVFYPQQANEREKK